MTESRRLYIDAPERTQPRTRIVSFVNPPFLTPAISINTLLFGVGCKPVDDFGCIVGSGDIQWRLTLGVF